MYTSHYTLNDFDDTCVRVKEQLDRSCATVRSSKYTDADIFTIYGTDVSSLKEAIYGLRHIEEMTYTVAEHHPYWRLLSGLAEATRITLERWDNNISDQDADDIRWCLSSVTDALNKLPHNQ
ncbi:MAG: hypothetical protein F4010_03140 [Cenarchaeum sp. SB0669_bin_11]|nr:hypothetical protein [Cenarchaeum sp. SB0675_bin_21]MYL11147.1 hypothetical protein [Cenarchaeum sp. SB0669_bin_11]